MKSFGIPISTILSRWLMLIFKLLVMNSGAERLNGLMAMLGIVAGIGAYATTGQIIPGVF